MREDSLLSLASDVSNNRNTQTKHSTTKLKLMRNV